MISSVQNCFQNTPPSAFDKQVRDSLIPERGTATVTAKLSWIYQLWMRSDNTGGTKVSSQHKVHYGDRIAPSDATDLIILMIRFRNFCDGYEDHDKR